MGFSDKSYDNFAVAMYALNASKYNVAASRFYYALYQACVNAHINNGKVATDFMSSDEAEKRKDALRTDTDAPKWPHDVLVRSGSLNDIGLNRQERMVVAQMKRLRTVGDYGRDDKVRREDLESHVACISNMLRARLGIQVERV